MIPFLKAVWQFCSYLFVPQWGRHLKDAGTTEIRNHGITEPRTMDQDNLGFRGHGEWIKV